MCNESILVKHILQQVNIFIGHNLLVVNYIYNGLVHNIKLGVNRISRRRIGKQDKFGEERGDLKDSAGETYICHKQVWVLLSPDSLHARDRLPPSCLGSSTLPVSRFRYDHTRWCSPNIPTKKKAPRPNINRNRKKLGRP